MLSRIEELIIRRLDTLPGGLREHILRVEKVASELAILHGVDAEKVRLGALAHDIARALKAGELLRMAHELGITIHQVERQVPILLHGPVAAEVLRHTGSLDDRDVYQAVYWHSTAHGDLGPVAKVVFLADKLDPHKVGRYPYLAELKDLAVKSLDRAVLEFLNRELVSLVQSRSLIHPASIEARNALLIKSQS